MTYICTFNLLRLVFNIACVLGGTGVLATRECLFDECANISSLHRENVTTFQPETLPNWSVNGTDVPRSDWDVLQEKASTLLAYKAGQGIHTYWLPIVIPAGLIGNTLSFLVMMRPHNRKISCCVYMAGLAIADNAMLVNAAYYWYVTNVARRPWFETECYIFSYLFHAFSLNSVIFIVVLTIDRFIAICYPLKRPVWCTALRARIVAIILFPLNFLVEVPHYFFVRIVDGNTCAGFSAENKVAIILSWVYMFLNAFIPFISIIILNTFIIARVRMSNKFTSEKRQICSSVSTISEESTGTAGTRGTKDQRSTRDKQLLVMLMLVSFALLILLLPIHIRYTVYLFINRKQSSQTLSVYVLVYNFTNKLVITNSAVNFVLYCIGGSKFRQDLAGLFCAGQDKDDVCVPSVSSRNDSIRTDQVELHPGPTTLQ